jgi:hypothetical protein
MATFREATIQQSTGEIRKWTADFTDDLPTGVIVTGGTATHIPPSGSASTVTVTVGSPYVYAQLGPLALTGIHYVDILATFSDGEKSNLQIGFAVNYADTAARASMANLVSTLRGLTNTGFNDYVIAGQAYWTDKHLQSVLDRYKTDIREAGLTPCPMRNTGGSIDYKEYQTHAHWLESTDSSGSARFIITDVTGTVQVSSLWSADYENGVITFVSDQANASRFLTAHSYDIYAAAADVWRQKAASYATMIDFSTINQTIKRSHIVSQCEAMAKRYESMATSGGASSVDIVRGDQRAHGRMDYD